MGTNNEISGQRTYTALGTTMLMPDLQRIIEKLFLAYIAIGPNYGSPLAKSPARVLRIAPQWLGSARY